MTLQGIPTVPCKWCNVPTAATALRECHACWMVRSTAQSHPDVVRRILASVENEQKEGE